MDDSPCPPRRLPGRPRSEAARRAILRAAHDLLARAGCAGVTMEAIAQRAGVSKATLYRWWPSKAAVLMDAFLETATPCRNTPDTGCLREDLRRQMRAAVQALSGPDGRSLASALAEAQADPQAAARFRASYLVPQQAGVHAMLARAQACGELRAEADLDTVTDALYGPLYFRLLAGHAALTPCFAEALVEVALHGVEKR